jgi:hypothetical protein
VVEVQVTLAQEDNMAAAVALEKEILREAVLAHLVS